jgi:chaperonin GroEL (HSP60 family)
MITHPILNPDIKRTKGSQARKYNLLAARLIKEILSNSFGPVGKEKMCIDILGEVTLTKDGATILRKIDVEHPAAKVLIDASNSVDNEVGDGTLSVVILSGALLEKAEELLNMNISPTTIIDGYDIGLKISLEILHKISKEKMNKDIEIMEKLANTCLGTKIISYGNDNDGYQIAKLIVDAVYSIVNSVNNGIDIDDIKIEEKIGNLSDTKLVKGTIIDKTIDSATMPKYLENAKILLLDEDLDGKRTRTDAEINIYEPKQMQSYINEETQILKAKVRNIINSGATIVISRKGISLRAQDYLSKAGIISIKRVKENDLWWLEKATGGNIIHDLINSNLSENLGYAGKVYEKFVGNDKMVFVDECQSPKSVTILLRANSKLLLDEFHRSVLSTIVVIKNFILNPSIVMGGGSCEAIIAHRIREKALEFNGKEQIVMYKFAEALEEIPAVLAKNSGMNVTDAMIQLRSNVIHNISDDTIKWFGVNVMDRKIGEMSSNILESSLVKEQILKTAGEITRLLISIDDVLIAKPAINTHTHDDGIQHSHAGGDKKHDHYFDKLGKQQRPSHHYY